MIVVRIGKVPLHRFWGESVREESVRIQCIDHERDDDELGCR